MHNEMFKSYVIAVLPGDVTITAVVRDDVEEQEVTLNVPDHIPPAAFVLQLALVLNASCPNGVAKFHIWRALRHIKENFEEINDKMANVPAISEDELPF